MGAKALMALSVFAPASIGNVSVGFDVLGMAVKPVDGSLLGDVITIKSSATQESVLSVVGEFAKKLPADPKENIVWQCLTLFNNAYQAQGGTPKPVELILDKKMPVGSGLGSSACSITAALFALNEFYQQPLTQNVLLELMGKMEAAISGSLHYDNVAPCYLGGLQLMIPSGGDVCRSLPTFDDCYWVMAYPGIEVSTKMAREVLPHQYSRADLITASQNLACFVDGCHRQDKHAAFSVLKDIVAEPYREGLLPKFSDAKQHMIDSGALASGISGSGPTLFAVFDSEQQATTMAAWLQQHYLQSDLGFVHVCKTDTQGACVLPELAD